MLQDCRADARCPGLPGFVCTQVRGENDDVITGSDAVEGVRHRTPAAPERAIDEDEIGRAGPRREGRGAGRPDLADDGEAVPVQVRGERIGSTNVVAHDEKPAHRLGMGREHAGSVAPCLRTGHPRTGPKKGAIRPCQGSRSADHTAERGGRRRGRAMSTTTCLRGPRHGPDETAPGARETPGALTPDLVYR